LGLEASNGAFQVGYARADPTAKDSSVIGGVLSYSQQSGGFLVLGRQLWSAVWTFVWALAILADVPARLMAGRRLQPTPLPRALLSRVIAIAPWLLVVAMIGWPSQTCTGECWGFMEGGMIMV